MIMSIIRYRRGIKVLAILLVCLFTINTLSTAETIAPVPFKKATLGVQSVFKPLHEAGIEDSAELVYEIIGGVRLFLADENRNYSAVNGILTETYRNSKNKRKIEFLPGTKREGNRIKAKFYVIGREDTVFEIEYTDTESKKDIKKHDGIQYPELKEQLDLMTIYEKTMFDHLGKFQNKIVNPDEYGSIKYTHVHPSESSPDVLVNENNKLVVGSKRFGACIACVLTWMKDGNRYIWIGHYYPPKQQRYNIFLKDKIERLKKEGIKKESIKLILHTSLYGKELMENDGCVQIDSKILSKEMDLVEKNIAINIKTRMPEGYKEKIEFAAISNVIVTNRGVIISYEGMDTKRQIVLWDTMETWVESDLFAEQQKDKIIETNTVIKEIKKEKKETQPADEISVKDAGLHNTAPVEQLTWGNVFQEDDEIVIRISEASVKDKEADSEDDITIGPHKTRGSPDSAKKEKKNNAIQLSSLDKPSLDKILFQTRNDEKIKLVFDLDQYINRKNGLAYVSPQILYVFFRLLQDENIYPEVIGNIVSLSAASKNQIESQRKCLKSEERMDFSDIAMGVFCGMVDDGVFNEFCEIRQNIRFEKFPGTTKLLLVDSPGLGEQASEGLFRIASYLSLFGIETEIINPDKEKVFKKRDDFHIAGVRFVTASLKESLSWVNAIKSTNPGSLVVVGGHEVRSVDRVFDLSSNVDCSIKRLGESGMLDVVMEAQIEKDGITDENKEFILKKLKKVHTREKESVIKPKI